MKPGPWSNWMGVSDVCDELEAGPARVRRASIEGNRVYGFRLERRECGRDHDGERVRYEYRFRYEGCEVAAE